MPWMFLALLAALLSSCRGDLPALTPTSVRASPPPVSPQASAHPAAFASRSARRRKPEVVGVLNLNRATEAELRLLPGVGKGRAQAIIERRAQRPFGSLDEVARIRGLKGVVRRLRSFLKVSGDSTLRPAPRPPRGEQVAAASVGVPAG